MSRLERIVQPWRELRKLEEENERLRGHVHVVDRVYARFLTALEKHVDSTTAARILSDVHGQSEGTET